MNHTQASACDPCPPRYYCVNKNKADPCPQGRACPGNTGFNMTLCPRGTYSNVEMLLDVSECKPCDPGSYCDAPGLTAVSGPCTAGFYCHSGVDTSAPSGNNSGFGGEHITLKFDTILTSYNCSALYNFSALFLYLGHRHYVVWKK